MEPRIRRIKRIRILAGTLSSVQLIRFILSIRGSSFSAVPAGLRLESTRGRFKEPLSAGLGIAVDLLRRVFQVDQVSFAESTADLVYMKPDIVGPVRFHHTHQKRPEVASRRAAEPMSPPDFANGVAPLVALANKAGDALPQRR